jgi:hypothetical protein
MLRTKARFPARRKFLICHLEGRAVLRPHFPPVVNARRRDIRMPQPLLDLGDIGFMVERVGRGGGAQRMRPEAGDLDFQGSGIAGQHLVHAIGRDRRAAVGVRIVLDRPK